MASVYRVTAVWSGFTGAPGYSKFSFSDLTDATSRNSAVARVRQLFIDLNGTRQIQMGVLVNPSIDEFDVATGALIGSAMATAVASVPGTVANTTPFVGGSGFCITWNTSTIINRRRLRGRTFFVPALSAFDVDGSLTTAVITLINTAATAFVATSAPRPVIWNRVFNTADPPVQVGGQVAAIDTYTLRDMASQLRSRRL